MSQMKSITIYNSERAGFKRKRRYRISLYPSTSSFEYENLLKDTPVKRRRDYNEFHRFATALEALLPRLYESDGLLKRDFSDLDAYRRWREEDVFFEDQDVLWRINYEYCDGSITTVICIQDNVTCPREFDDVEAFLKGL